MFFAQWHEIGEYDASLLAATTVNRVASFSYMSFSFASPEFSVMV